MVRFVWGKSFNVRGVITAIAERLEHFNFDGVPRRSWIRLRLLRVNEPPPANTGPAAPRQSWLFAHLSVPLDAVAIRLSHLVQSLEAGGQLRSHLIKGSGAAGRHGFGERLDEIAHRFYGAARNWRTLAIFNDIANPLRLMPGFVLRIPPPGIVLRVSSRGFVFRFSWEKPTLRISLPKFHRPSTPPPGAPR